MADEDKQTATSKIEVQATDAAPVAAEVDPTGGVDDGIVEKDNTELNEAVRDRIEHRERVVHEVDESGNVIGFHKEPVEEGAV